jgi:maltose O-acetyltransferase
MKSEKEKMLAGELYNPLDPELVRDRLFVRERCMDFNQSRSADAAGRAQILEKIFGKQTDVWLEPPFYCDYGTNITLGSKVFFNFNCVVLDVMAVHIGNHTMFGPSVQIYTAMHPVDADERRRGLEFAKPVRMGSDIWWCHKLSGRHDWRPHGYRCWKRGDAGFASRRFCRGQPMSRGEEPEIGKVRAHSRKTWDRQDWVAFENLLGGLFDCSPSRRMGRTQKKDAPAFAGASESVRRTNLSS